MFNAKVNLHMAWKEPSLVAWTDMLERLWKHDLDEHRLEGSSHDKETREKNKKLLRNILKERVRRSFVTDTVMIGSS